jgi:polyhydroxybutyrate depolymerase
MKTVRTDRWVQAIALSLATILLLTSGVACRRRADVNAPRPDPNNREIDLNFGGRDRFAVVHVPASYEPGKPTPAVLVFHGGGGFPDAVRFQSRMDEVSDRHGFIAVYPAGTGIMRNAMLSFNAGTCCGYAMTNKVDDVGFTAALLDELAKRYSVDPDRVYAAGLSNGGMLVYRLACELSDRIAAIGPVATTLTLDNCRPTRPVSVIHFHGLKDRNIPYRGGKGAKSLSQIDCRGTQETIDLWVRLNGCPTTPTETTRGAATRLAYGPGRDGAEVVLWRIADGGHTWPGGEISRLEGLYGLGKVNRDIVASELMWEFFQRHPRSTRASR